MSFEWSEYLVLAEELATRPSGSTSQEAELRSAISRAYYATFCKGRNFLIAKGMVVPRGVDTHKFVQDQFKRSSDRTRKKIGHNLGRLRRHRNQADYDNTVTDLFNLAQADILMADETINKLKSLP